jgi:hypothetical protein
MKNNVLETLLEVEARTNDAEPSQTSSILELITESKPSSAVSFEGVLIGKLTGFDDAGKPLVRFVYDVPVERVLARSTIPLKKDQVGSDVVMAFEQGDLGKPIIIGSLWQPENSRPQEPMMAELDGQRIILTAEKEIVLRCGKASITLTQAGKVLIRGAYLSTHSSGVNRIKGGSVQIN